MGWFFEFKLHLICNGCGELLNFIITPEDADDRKPLEYKALVEFIFGKLVGDKGYIGKNLFEKLSVDGIQLITRLKSNMKGALMWISGFFRLVECHIRHIGYLCWMKAEQLLRAILPDVLIDNFDVVNFEKTDHRFDIWLDEKKVQLKEDKRNSDIIAYGFGEYHEIRDFPIRGRGTYLHVRKRKWLDKSCGEIFSYDWDLSEFDSTRLNAEFVSFLKEGD